MIRMVRNPLPILILNADMVPYFIRKNRHAVGANKCNIMFTHTIGATYLCQCAVAFWELTVTDKLHVCV